MTCDETLLLEQFTLSIGRDVAHMAVHIPLAPKLVGEPGQRASIQIQPLGIGPHQCLPLVGLSSASRVTS